LQQFKLAMPLWVFSGSTKHASAGGVMKSPLRTDRIVYHKGVFRSPLVNNRKHINIGMHAAAGTKWPRTTRLDWTSHYNGKSKGASIAAETSGPSNGVRMAESSKARIVSVDEYLVIAGGWSIFQNRLFAAMSLLYMCVSFDMFLAVFLAPTLGAQWGLTIPQQGLIASSWFVGGLIGYVLSGLFADTLGRRPTLLALSVLRCFGDCFTLPQRRCHGFLHHAYWQRLAQLVRLT